MKRTKSLFLSSTALSALFALPAFAQTTPVFDWSGFYVGADVGQVWAKSSLDDVDGAVGATGHGYDLDRNDVIAGIHGGYNWQSDNLVFGLEADWNFTSSDDSRSFVGSFLAGAGKWTAELSNLATIRARAGMAFEEFLLYGTGGIAFVDLTNSINFSGVPATASRDSSPTGWTIGGGGEYAFDANWSARVEYLYTTFSNESDRFTNGPYTLRFKFKDSAPQLRFGISYGF